MLTKNGHLLWATIRYELSFVIGISGRQNGRRLPRRKMAAPPAASLVAPAAVQRDPIQPQTSNLHSNRRKVEVDARLVSTEMCIMKLNWIPVWIRLLVTSNRLPAVLPVIRQIRPVQEDRPPEGATAIHTGIISKHYFERHITRHITLSYCMNRPN